MHAEDFGAPHADPPHPDTPSPCGDADQAEEGLELPPLDARVGRRGTRTTGDSETLPCAGDLVQEDLRAFDKDESFAEWVCEQAGLEFLLNSSQTLYVGDYAIRASLWHDDRDRYVLRLYNHAIESLCLGELYAASSTGQVERLEGVALAQWKRRALIAAHRAHPSEVALCELPLDAPSYARKTWAIIEQILETRIGDETEIALSAPKTARWWASTEATIRNGKVWLRKHGFIRKVGERPSGHRNGTHILRIRMAGEPPLNAIPLDGPREEVVR